MNNKQILKNMKNQTKQTAVEWLEKEQDNLFISYQKGFMSAGRFIFLQHKLYQQAKEMEKERMIQLVQGLKDYTHESHTILGHDERNASEFVDIFLQRNLRR